jgi:hypothetical protein
MSVPNYLAVAFNYLETLAVTDVANTITRIGTQLVALGWVNTAANTWQSPTDSGGHWIKLTFNKILAAKLEMVFIDSLSRTFTRRAIAAATFTERLYCNTFGFCYDAGNGSGLWASIYDMSPELQDAHDQFCTGHGKLTVADADDSTFFATGGEQLSEASPRAFAPIALTAFFTRGGFDSGGLPFPYSQAGSRLWYPINHHGPSVVAGTMRVRGRLFQMLHVSSAEAAQSEFSVPLDQATTGLFKILSFPAHPSFAFFMAARKA